MAVKTRAEARANLEAALPQIGARYKAGVAKADWQTPAASDQAEENFATKMNEALSARSRQNAIRGMSNADWQRAAGDKGAPVIAERIRQNLAKWETNWGPIYDQVVNTVQTLPERTTDFRTNISNRLVAVVEAWKRAAGKPV